jgi:2-methylcitrate dehydratase
VEFADGKRLPEIVVEYPIGHKRRRKEGMPVLMRKFASNLARVFPAKQAARLLALGEDSKRLDALPVHEFVDFMVL